MHRNYTSQTTKQQKNNCPHCGWETTRGFSFEQILAGTLPENVRGDFTAFRSTPTRNATTEASLLVPIGQTLATAIAVALPSFVLASWLKWEWEVPFVVGTVTILVQWIRCLNSHERTLAVIEEFSYSPALDGVGEKSTSLDLEAIRMEVTSEKSDHLLQMKIVELPAGVSSLDFANFCEDILSGKSLARREWVGNGKQFSRDTYDDLIDAMLVAGLVRSIPGKGKGLTLGGRRAITRLLQSA